MSTYKSPNSQSWHKTKPQNFYDVQKVYRLRKQYRFDEALELARQVGDESALAWTLESHIKLNVGSKNYERALQYYQELDAIDLTCVFMAHNLLDIKARYRSLFSELGML